VFKSALSFDPKPDIDSVHVLSTFRNLSTSIAGEFEPGVLRVPDKGATPRGSGHELSPAREPLAQRAVCLHPIHRRPLFLSKSQ
jgi:hypothetical protein